MPISAFGPEPKDLAWLLASYARDGLARVEAGAQGPHKVVRGYLPEATYSAHWIREPAFRDAVARFLDAERSHVSQDIDWIERRSPFKAGIDLSAIRSGV